MLSDRVRLTLAWLVLVIAALIVLRFMWFLQIQTKYEGFASAENPLDAPSISRLLSVIQRMSAIVTQPSFFTDAIRKSQMSAMDMAREHLNATKIKSE
jgi:hypothetical protein